MATAVVLGAGGRVGAAYLAGALTALEVDLGFDSRDADLLVGTSAGSLVGAALRAGVPPTDLAAWAVGARCTEAGAALPETADTPEFPPVSMRDFLRAPRLPSWSWLARAARAPWRVDLLRAYLSHLPHGRHELAPHLAWLDAHFGDRWPDAPLWLVAADALSGGRRVLGWGATEATVATGVAASCAVPGYFSPVSVGSQRLVDGGVVSTTNADLVARSELPIDLAIVIAPMSTSSPVRRPDVMAMMRRRVAAQIDHEVAVLERAGIAVLRIEPGAETTQLAGFDFMAGEHDTEIVRAAVLETGTALQRDPLARRFDRRHAVA